MAEKWQEVWHRGIAPQLSDAGLEALAVALRDDSPELLQGATVEPPPLLCVANWKPQAACVVGLCGWHGNGLNTVEEVDRYFSRVCMKCDNAMNEPGVCRWFFNWADETPRDVMRAALLPEVEAVLAVRKAMTA